MLRSYLGASYRPLSPNFTFLPLGTHGIPMGKVRQVDCHKGAFFVPFCFNGLRALGIEVLWTNRLECEDDLDLLPIY